MLKRNINKIFKIVLDGGWSIWGAWEECSASCGVGMKLQNRMCDDPKPLTNGKQCLGNSQDVILCNEQACPKF